VGRVFEAYQISEGDLQMSRCHFLRFVALASILAMGVVTDLRADDGTFRYVRPYGGRAMNFAPYDSFAFVGGQVYPLSTGSRLQSLAPNSWLNFRHPYTHAYVTVPVALPIGTPKVEHRLDRIIYDYASVAVVIHFVRDGSVNVSYNQKTP
jgi:hypothetical protein